ncbi:cupin domain-containing protein [Miltoncostaea marina]|uniref:cupin domain-containing protein n=1 Tax=Miltoncostaea marina TaxID=2843215 RepID=UPI001C3DD259|nr:cupin domain-containing protein [Miltoncostaea marina]
MAGWTRIDPGEVEERERRGGGASSRDLAGALGAESMTARLWRYGPGHEMAYHRHQTQEELYQLVSGGPQEIMVDGETVTVQDGEWLRFHKDTPRRIQNHTDREAVWLTIGAPPGEGIRDGIRLDPATGEVIPRT